MFDRQLRAQYIKDMLATGDTVTAHGVFFLAGKAVGELAAVVSEKFDDSDRTGIFNA